MQKQGSVKCTQNREKDLGKFLYKKQINMYKQNIKYTNKKQ